MYQMNRMPWNGGIPSEWHHCGTSGRIVLNCFTELLIQYFMFFSPVDQMARQQDVHQTGDYHCDPEHPPGGQEREDQGEISHHLRGHDPCGDTQGYNCGLCSEISGEHVLLRALPKTRHFWFTTSGWYKGFECRWDNEDQKSHRRRWLLVISYTVILVSWKRARSSFKCFLFSFFKIIIWRRPFCGFTVQKRGIWQGVFLKKKCSECWEEWHNSGHLLDFWILRLCEGRQSTMGTVSLTKPLNA